MTSERMVWIFRCVWFLLPLTAGAASSAVDSDAAAAGTATTILAWVIWAVVTLAAFAPHPVSLTAVRVLAPLSVAFALWLLVSGDLAAGALFVAHAAVATLLSVHQMLGDRFADGASYGDERRMLLRPPAPIMLVGIPVAWLAAVASVPGVLLLADSRLVAGGVLSAIGLVAGPFAARALYQLARRWVVFVPTGFVLHDYAVLTEPVLFRRTAIERLGAAIEGTPARDLTNQAAGLQLECELADPAPLGLVTARDGSAELTKTRRFLICPTRPGALLDEAERRGIATD